MFKSSRRIVALRIQMSSNTKTEKIFQVTYNGEAQMSKKYEC